MMRCVIDDIYHEAFAVAIWISEYFGEDSSQELCCRCSADNTIHLNTELHTKIIFSHNSRRHKEDLDGRCSSVNSLKRNQWRTSTLGGNFSTQ